MTYLVQIDDTVREATPEEVKQIEAQAKRDAELVAQLAATAAARASARKKLADLGLTDDEIAALVGR